MKRLKIAFAGVGFMGQRAHLRNYHELVEFCDVVALADLREDQANNVAARYNIPKVYPTIADMFKNEEIDAVVASQPYSNHINVIPEVLNAGYPVFSEKPIAISVESGQMLADLAKKKNKLYMVGYHKRSDPAMEYAKKLIEQYKKSGELGQFRYVRATMPPGDWVNGGSAGYIGSNYNVPELPLEGKPDYFTQDVYDAYNAFVNYYIHQVNAVRFLLNEDYKITYAEKSGVLLAGESDSGVCCTIEMEPYSSSMDWQESYFISFSRGYIKVELPAPLASQQAGKVTVFTDIDGEPKFFQPVMPCIHAMRNQAMNFMAAVRGDKPAPCEAAEAVKDLRIARDYISLKLGLTFDIK